MLPVELEKLRYVIMKIPPKNTTRRAVRSFPRSRQLLNLVLAANLTSLVIIQYPVYAHDDNHGLGIHNNVETTSNPFWANRLGGGRYDVFIHTIEDQNYIDLSPYSEVSPVDIGNGEWEFEVSADSKAYVAHPELDLQHEVDVFADGPQSRSSAIAIRPIPNPDDVSISSRSLTENPNRVGILSEGSWKVRTKSNTSPAPLLINLENSDYALSVSQKEEVTKKGRRLYLSAHLAGVTEDESDTLVRSGEVVNNSRAIVKVIVKLKGKKVLQKQLRDSGKSSKHNDMVRGDGHYGAVVELSKEGDYAIVVRYRSDSNGQRIQRSSTSSALVSKTRLKAITSSVTATADYVLGRRIEQGRYGVPVSVRVTRGEMPEHISIRAEVWAKDSKGADSVIGWTGGMVQPTPLSSNSEKWQIPFTFHSGWLFQEDYYGPLTLRNITIRSASTGDDLLWNRKNHTVAVTGIDINSLQSNQLTTKLSVEPITDSMEMGVHPGFIDDNGQADRSTGGISARHAGVNHDFNSVLIIPGFNEASMEEHHFNQAMQDKVFSIPRPINANVCSTAYEKAVEIMQHFGWQAGRLRGAIAHSHGGLVGAELLQNFSYIFYDNAQSRTVNVLANGSPFNGSWLGDRSTSSYFYKLFRSIDNAVGGNLTSCSVPYELRRSESPRWRSRILSRARSQIFSFYTHTKHSYGICHKLLSPIINGKDDGVIVPNDAINFATGGVESGRHYCHSHGSWEWSGSPQWVHHLYTNRVVNTFSSDHEPWQPF